MFARSGMLETLGTRRFLSATPAAGDLATESPPPQEIALLLPAVQAAREAARSTVSDTTAELTAPADSPAARVLCQNNLKQIAIAAH